ARPRQRQLALHGRLVQGVLHVGEGADADAADLVEHVAGADAGTVGERARRHRLDQVAAIHVERDADALGQGIRPDLLAQPGAGGALLGPLYLLDVVAVDTALEGPRSWQAVDVEGRLLRRRRRALGLLPMRLEGGLHGELEPGQAVARIGPLGVAAAVA